MGLIFCRVCRKNPVQLHIENNSLNMRETSRSVICDECLKTKTLNTMSQGEWRCEYCGELVYKFAQNNILYGMLLNTSPANIALEYGKMEVKVKCNKCKKENIKTID
jgi:ribosomal protein S27E